MQAAYALLGKTEISLDQLSMHFTNALHLTTLDVVLRHSEPPPPEPPARQPSQAAPRVPAVPGAPAVPTVSTAQATYVGNAGNAPNQTYPNGAQVRSATNMAVSTGANSGQQSAADSESTMSAQSERGRTGGRPMPPNLQPDTSAQSDQHFTLLCQAFTLTRTLTLTRTPTLTITLTPTHILTLYCSFHHYFLVALSHWVSLVHPLLSDLCPHCIRIQVGSRNQA